MKKLLYDWHFARILQLIFGLTSLGYGLYSHDSTYLFVAAIFLVQAIFNLSLCGAAGCSTPTRDRATGPKIRVEEYKAKK